MFFLFSHFNSVTNSGITCKSPYKLFVLFFLLQYIICSFFYLQGPILLLWKKN